MKICLENAKWIKHFTGRHQSCRPQAMLQNLKFRWLNCFVLIVTTKAAIANAHTALQRRSLQIIFHHGKATTTNSRAWKYHLFFDIISYHIICQKKDIISFISYH
jgi:hypothetical protein